MWGYVGANNKGWFGSGQRVAYYRNELGPAPEPKVFLPTDISNCALWLDSDDGRSVIVNEDTSGVNLNRVMKWFDKAQPSNQNYYTHVGNPASSGLYNMHTMNGLNTVYFEGFTVMDHQNGGTTFNFQDRTFFAVIKPLSDLTIEPNPYINIYNAFQNVGGMNTGIGWDSNTSLFSYVMCENSIQCGVTFDLSNNPLNNRLLLMLAQSSTDISNNVGSFDTISQPLVNNFIGSNFNTGNIQYQLHDQNKATSQDIAEIILYGRVLTPTEQTTVLEYLADKWNLSGPTGHGVNTRKVYNNDL